jgi:hypothetical protein
VQEEWHNHLKQHVETFTLRQYRSCRGLRHLGGRGKEGFPTFFLQNKAIKLLKILEGVPKSDETKPKFDADGRIRFRVAMVGEQHIFSKNNPTKLLKTQDRCPETNKTIPISDTVGATEILMN